ncbi:MAG TPA: hypothetical protein VJU61_11230 [Polyangiaceae bacterium]|nr:hypothetical protein [Polyangiaceae bacterium]
MACALLAIYNGDMSTFRLSHPTNTSAHATYGVDITLGFFVEVVGLDGQRQEYDQLHTGYRGLDGALEFLASHGFFTRDALMSAKVLLNDHGSEVIRVEPEHSPATVICNMKEWASPEPLLVDCECSSSSMYQVRIGKVGHGWRLQVFCPSDSDGGRAPMYDVGSTAAPLSNHRIVDILCTLGFDGLEWRSGYALRSDLDDPEFDFPPYEPAELIARGMKEFEPLPSWLELEQNLDIGSEASRLRQEDEEADEKDLGELVDDAKDVPF